MEYNFYDVLAWHYDEMQSDMDTHHWADLLDSLIREHGKIAVNSITDLGCGTGSVDILLADKGYQITGIDSAEGMLVEASSKDPEGRIIWSLQDITDFELPENTDCFLSLLDTLDHIMEPDVLQRVFDKVSENLNEGGLFIFDVITEKHLEETLGDNIFYEDYEDFTLLWQNRYDKDTKINTAELTFFTLRDDGAYDRADGDLVERFYALDLLEKMGGKSGLKLASTLSEDEERVFMVFIKE